MRGDGCFEVLRSYGGVFYPELGDEGVAFTLGVGLERFEAFLPLLGLQVPGPARVSG